MTKTAIPIAPYLDLRPINSLPLVKCMKFTEFILTCKIMYEEQSLLTNGNHLKHLKNICSLIGTTIQTMGTCVLCVALDLQEHFKRSTVNRAYKNYICT